MKRRVFIAINLPEEIKEELSSCREEINKFFSSFGDNFQPIRWTKKENLHITLAFLGYLDDNKIKKVEDILAEISQEASSFLVELSEICYGPKNEKIPRMVWAIGNKSKYFSELKEKLDKELQEKISFHLEKRDFLPHITLGRIRKWQWKAIKPEERPEVEKNISLKFRVKSIELMESHLKRGGPEYTVIKSFQFP